MRTAQAGQQRDAGQPERQPGQLREAEPGVIQPGVDAEQPQRHRGDEQRGEPGRHGLLADAHHAVGHEQQDADDRAAHPLRAGGPVTPGRPGRARPRPAAPQGEREHDQAGRQVPRRRHQQRRHRLDPDPDGQVGAAPHHPYDEQANPGDQVDPPRRTRLFLIPNDPGRLRSVLHAALFRGVHHGRVPLTHDHQACQAAARRTSGSIAIVRRNPAIPCRAVTGCSG